MRERVPNRYTFYIFFYLDKTRRHMGQIKRKNEAHLLNQFTFNTLKYTQKTCEEKKSFMRKIIFVIALDLNKCLRQIK